MLPLFITILISVVISHDSNGAHHPDLPQIVSSYINDNIHFRSPSFGLTCYVSTTGSDANNGSISSPFQSLNRARDAIRSLKQKDTLPDGGVLVYIR